MGAWLSSGLHLVFVVFVAAACAVRARGSSTKLRRGAWFALGALPLGLLSAWFCVLASWIRFDLGATSVPWLPAVFLFVLHTLALAWIWKRIVRSEAPIRARSLPLAFGALAAFAFESVVLSNLELRGRLVASACSIEAGRKAFRVDVANVDDANNAARLYAPHIETIQREDRFDLDDWYAMDEPEKPLDPHDPKLRAVLAEWAPILADVRKAARLPHCQFGAPSDDFMRPAAPAIALFHFATALGLEARVKAADGDLETAVADVAAAYALARHVAETPSIVTTLTASVIRAAARVALARVISARGAPVTHLAALDLSKEPRLVAGLPSAMTMEEAYGLGMLGAAFVDEQARFSFVSGPFQHELYLALMFEDEVRGYRACIAEMVTLAGQSPAEILRFKHESMAGYQARVRAAGLLPAMLSGNLLDHFLAAHASDAELVLARLAVDAKGFELEHGRYPTTRAELANLPADVVLEGDGTFVLLRNTSTAFTKSVELRVPPENRSPR
ncbi:MAG: hypothetical protein HZA53_07505 [Planctomycetes bacterium]|nr:hypothetical protein [Planctomycetota bacterium]